MFYILCRNLEERTALIVRLRDEGILAVFHYLSLHSSTFYQDKHDGRPLPHCDGFADRLLRLPMFFELAEEDVDKICSVILDFYRPEA